MSLIFPQRAAPVIKRMTEGVSTDVYRLHFGTITLYLRVLPEPDATFAPEALVHDLLRSRGVPVPEVVYCEECNELLQRSIMLTTEIPGAPLTEHGLSHDNPSILLEAGKCLAIINSIPVEGYGWIRREPQPGPRTKLEAGLANYRAFVDDSIDRDLVILRSHILNPLETGKLERIAHKYRDHVDPQPAVLAHGDFDTTHIFQKGGRFSGIIDFGEIRGADSWYDLGHFRLHDGELLPSGLYQWILDGYRLNQPEQAKDEEHIVFASLLIAARTLTRAIVKNASNSAYLAFLHRSIRRDLDILDA